MMTNWSNQIWTDAGPGWKGPSREALVERVAGQVDLANFQPSAVFQGLVDAIVWLRSDFPLGQYNGPPPGHYRQLLAMPDYAAEGREPDPIIGDGARPLLTCFPGSGESFCEYGPRLAHEARRGAQQRRPHIPVERNTLWDDSWECTRPPLERLSAAFNYSVVTLEQLVAPSSGVLEDVRRQMKAGPGGSQWILDVDLDYFATYSPLLAFLLRKHGWTDRAEAEVFAAWAVPLGRLCSQGLEASTRETLFAPACQERTVRAVVRLPFLAEGQGQAAQPSAEDVLRTFRGIHAGCQIPQGLLEGLSGLVCRLTPRQRQQWAALQAEDWWWVMQSQGPHHYSSPEEISAQVRKLEPVLRAFPEPPSLVTVARSMDMYMPEGASDLAEWELLLLLKRVWGGGGARPPLPVQLRDCSEEDVERLLDGVAFYPVSRPLPGQEPEPLRPRPWPFAPGPGSALHVPTPTVAVRWCGDFEPVD